MERNYPAAGFGDLGSGTGWSYDRSAKASFMYGSAGSSHPDSELLHRQAYGTPHPLQSYATNHHPGGSRQGGAWGGRTLGLSGLFDASLHHSGPSGPDPSVMNLISALDSRGPQPPPSASSLLTQFRTPSWQTAMHTPAPTELFISGALPGSGSFPSSSALSAYQHPGSFSGRSFTPSLSLQDTPTFSPSSNGLLSPHDPLLHIKTSSQSSLGFDRLLSSQSSAYRSSQELAPMAQNHAPPNSSSCHLPPPQFNLLSSQLHNQSSQLYNASMFSSTPALIPSAPPQPLPPHESAIPRQDTVIKHYQRSSPAHSTPLPLQRYLSCGGSMGFQQMPSQHRHAGMSCSSLEEHSPPSDPKPSLQSESQPYQPNIQTPYTSSSSSLASSSLSGSKENKSSTSGNSSNSTSSSSRTSQTPPTASSSTSSSSSNPKTSTGTLSAPSRQQPPPQPVPVPPPLPVVSSAQSAPKARLSAYGSPPGSKSSTSLPGQTPPHQQAQSYSPNQPASTHMSQSCASFGSPNPRDISSGAGGNGGKAYTDLGSGGRSFSAEIVFGDSSFSSASHRRAESPSLGYGNAAGSTGSGASGVPSLDTGLGSAGSGSASAASGGSNSYHLNESSPAPSIGSTVPHPGLHSPASARPAQSPGSSGASKYLPSMLSPTFLASSHHMNETHQQPYHSTPPKPKTQSNMLGGERSQEEEDDDFLIQQLLHTQSSTSHSAQHHQASLHRSQLPLSEEADAKGVTYDMNKISEERYHLHSVIRTNSAGTPDPETSISEVTSGLSSQLEISPKKQQQTKSDLPISKSTSEGVTDSLSHTNHSHQSEHDSLGSVGHYARGDPYTQHPHSHHISHLSPHSQSQQQLSQQNHPHSHPHMELKKASDGTDSSYLCNTTDVRQNQASHQMMNSPPDCPQQTQMLHSVMSRTKMDPQQAQQQHALSQQDMMGSSRGAGLAGVDSHTQNQSSQLQLQLQNQTLDTRYSLGAPREQSRINQNATLDMMDQRLSQSRSRDGGGGSLSLDRHGIRIGAEGDVVAGERHRQQHSLSSHHQTELHGFLSEPDMGLASTSHFHHVNPSQSHAQHQHQAHSHHQLSHLAHPQAHRMAANVGTPQQLQQSQPREPENHLSHTQMEPLKQHQYDTVSPGGKTRLNPNQQQEQFTSLTSICFSDSLLNDEDRTFFPGMDDMFCSANYKSSCAGNSVTGQTSQEDVTQARGQEGMDVLKTGDGGQRYGLVDHHGDQGYGQYCHGLSGSGNTNLNLDLDSMKTHDLPSTVNTDQLGLIQTQTPAMGLNPSAQDKMTGSVEAVGGSSNPGMTSAIFCSSRPKKMLKTSSSFHLLKQRREPQTLTKKNYAQEYEFEDDEDKADGPADIRLNSRRLPDLLPDLVSSCRKSSGTPGVGGLSPLMTDMDFCHPSTYSSLGHSQALLPQDGPKKRGRKPTKPKREGPPRPRGRPRIRPLPEPSYCRGLMGSAAGESRRGRGRGRGRGRREEGHVEIHQDMNKARNLPYQHQQQQQQQQQHFSHAQHLQQHPHEQHHGQQLDHHHISQHLLHHHVPPSHHPIHHQQQQHNYQQQMQQPAQQLQQDPGSPVKVALLGSAMPPSQSLLRTDSLSSTDPALSDGSMGSAPSLGPSPGPSANIDNSRNEINQTRDKMHHENSGEITWKKEMEDPLNPEAWGAMQKLSNSVDEKAFDFKPGFMSSFLDFLKTGKKQPGLQLVDDRCEEESMDTCSSLKGGIRPITPTPPLSPPPQQPFGEERGGEGVDLALSSCPSPCKPLDDELKENLEALPSFSSDEEDSVSKNQDLQKSISSAISALYDTPHSLAAAMASAMVKVPSTISPPTPQEPALSPLPPAIPPLVTAMANGEGGMLTYNQLHAPEENHFVSSQSNREEEEESQSETTGEHREEEEGGGGKTTTEEALEELKVKKEDRASERQRSEASKVEESSSGPSLAPAPLSASASVSPSPPTYSSPSPLPPARLSVSAKSPALIQQDEEVDPSSPPCKQQQEQQQVSYQAAPTAGTSPPPSTSPPAFPSPPLSNLPQSHSIAPPSTTPPPSCSDQDQEPEAGQASPASSSSSSSSPSVSSSAPPSPPTPEEAPASQRLTALHLAKKQADAAIAGESEAEDSESGGEGIFRERDEFVIRTEDIGTLKMALQTGREPPPIWRVQKALLQKFSPEIKDGQRQFCATSNYLGYFGDAKMRYQRLYVKFLENVNKKDYVRVCSRKPWHRTGLTLRRQTLPKQLPTPPRVERDDRDKERPKEKELKDKKEREKAEKEQKERERKERLEREKRERHRKEKETEQNEDNHRAKEQDKDKWQSEQREEKDKETTEPEREHKEREKWSRELREREEQDRKRQEEKDKQGKDRLQAKERVAQKDRHKEKEKDLARGMAAREVLEVRRGQVQCVKEESRGVDKKMVRHARGKSTLDKTEAPPKKRKKWMKELPSSSSESDSSLPSEDEGPLRVGLNSRAMREMFRSYVEMLVSTALDPDMIQALEDTDDELYLPPMRKIDSLLNEQKKRLLRRVTMSAQHQEALQSFPKMTADPLESGSVKVRLGGEGYNRKTLNRCKRSIPKQQDLKLSMETCRIYSLYHSLHHYKYHTFLHCKKETDSIEQAADDPGQEEVVQQCMANQSWLERLFNSFMELLSLSGKA
ncbi:proline-rich protein 12 isoform X1 [Syngnathus acus]|uniref:proline-rich protein 12 isoform X1 n=1 Tax=Syngnathus acus TaxID=161584 RepID=UPI001885E4DE|nr:proline-rich protein 12 isoform X1 [Syngnathus acus]